MPFLSVRASWKDASEGAKLEYCLSEQGEVEIYKFTGKDNIREFLVKPTVKGNPLTTIPALIVTANDFKRSLRRQVRVAFRVPCPCSSLLAGLLQRVISPQGRACGAILWEVKRTKNWTDNWLAKLRADQRAAGAEFAILVSRVLPKGIDAFGNLEGVWVSDVRFAVPLAVALRQTLTEVATARQAQEGQETKMELIYQYLTGPGFRHRVEAIVENFSEMQTDLQRERIAMTRIWAKREAQIFKMIGSTVGLYGDLQGIAGKAIQEIDGLEIPLLPDSFAQQNCSSRAELVK